MTQSADEVRSLEDPQKQLPCIGEAKRDGLRRDLTRETGAVVQLFRQRSSLLTWQTARLEEWTIGLAELAAENWTTTIKNSPVAPFLSLNLPGHDRNKGMGGPAVWGHGILLEGGPSPDPGRPPIGQRGRGG